MSLKWTSPIVHTNNEHWRVHPNITHLTIGPCCTTHWHTPHQKKPLYITCMPKLAHRPTINRNTDRRPKWTDKGPKNVKGNEVKKSHIFEVNVKNVVKSTPTTHQTTSKPWVKQKSSMLRLWIIIMPPPIMDGWHQRNMVIHNDFKESETLLT